MAISVNQEAFPLSARLIQSVQYQRVFRTGYRRAAKLFTMFVAPGTTDGARLGLVIAKRMVPRAVDRSRIKRLVRESFRHHRVLLPPLDIVVTVKPLTPNVANKIITRALHDQWQRLSDEYPCDGPKPKKH